MATALSACAALGLRVTYLGAMGNDDNGRRVREELLRRGVDLTHSVVRRGSNQFAVISVEEKTGERIVLWDRDDALVLTVDEVSAGVVSSARLLHVDDVEKQIELLRSGDSFNLWQSLLRGVGAYTGCTRCVDVCPVGQDYASNLKEVQAEIPEATPEKAARLAEMKRRRAAGEPIEGLERSRRWIGEET
jgi:ferredoxin